MANIYNPWWQSGAIEPSHQKAKPRACLELFVSLLAKESPRRAVILMGPRRVGKTWLLHHTVQWLIQQGTNPRSICYVDVQIPLFNGIGLEELVSLAREASENDGEDLSFVLFDEIQYLRNWETHLKALVDSQQAVRFIASGSAAAALRLKNNESGAGRFTDFLLPPLTFYEYLDLLNELDLVEIKQDEHERLFHAPDIEALNQRFMHYLNFGGYPEVVFSQAIQSDLGRYVRNDIVDKVLMKDLPSLYGIQDIQELNSLFTMLAYNTAGEVSLQALSQRSGVAKNTIKRYIEYLQSAFLIKVVNRIDRSAKRFRRANFFKVYLMNPSLRAAVFSPLGADDEGIGSLVETAIFSQWFHATNTELHYARWKSGEVDIVRLQSDLEPVWAVEVKWSDAFAHDPRKLDSLMQFCAEHRTCSALCTTRTKHLQGSLNGLPVEFTPASVYCFLLGFNIIRRKQQTIRGEQRQKENPQE